MNAITENIEISCLQFESYGAIDTGKMEDIYTDWLTKDTSKPYGYRHTMDFWKEKDAIKQ